ncbi:ferrochelatase, mitochondrial precursor [Aspergillus luchuensis]|uniref:Ferrochelatase, mitochondrial n=1 Tax=Aspergillus kawachii TaxID=1069201 RepID=A0A146FTB5_ASPKA|nr:ferrochelatase, mitochondrial precursor [Aspergillus luchuensis]
MPKLCIWLLPIIAYEYATAQDAKFATNILGISVGRGKQGRKSAQTGPSLGEEQHQKGGTSGVESEIQSGYSIH